MAAFEIIQDDPTKHKDKILQFWSSYLKNTPSARFEWMQNGNPAGPAIWFFAFDQKNGNLAGTISILPKDIYYDAMKIRAGILGDFMIHENYRAFGPALQLLKTTALSYSGLGFDLLYTLPNQASKKIAIKTGFEPTLTLRYLVKPVHMATYLRKHLNKPLADTAGAIADLIGKLYSKESRISKSGFFEIVDHIDGSFDYLDRQVKTIPGQLASDHSSEFLKWRYASNPLNHYKFLTLKSNLAGDLLGYIVFTAAKRKIEIFDIVFMDSAVADKLIAKLIQFAEKNDYQAIYIRLPQDNALTSRLQKFLFMDARADEELCGIGYKKHFPTAASNWHFFEGDRNI